jgi:hypothetical protein
MKPNQGFQPAIRRSNQSGDGESFAFNGQMGDGVNRKKESISCENPYTIGESADRQNYGQGPRVGNTDTSTRLSPVDTVTHPTARSGLIDGGRKWAPQARNNYQGNPDRINVGSGPRKGNT